MLLSCATHHVLFVHVLCHGKSKVTVIGFSIPFCVPRPDTLAFHTPSPETKALIASSSTQFLRRHVRMRDVREYIRDALVMYSSLQDFQPAPVEGASHGAGNDDDDDALK